jgi:hypothetical protein
MMPPPLEVVPPNITYADASADMPATLNNATRAMMVLRALVVSIFYASSVAGFDDATILDPASPAA